LTLEVRGNRAVLTVRDHGAGVPFAEREAMLQPFVRGEASRHQPGTGLGLAIVQRTVQRHQGRLLLEDAAPGLRVRLDMPLAQAR
jgi:signal transduction histidine kinase